MEDQPYQAEYARSNRSRCKTCKDQIDKDILRLAVMVQSRMFDGKTPNWFHYDCFFKRYKPNSVSDFKGFELIRFDDQKKIEESIQQKKEGNDVTDGKGEGRKNKASQKRKSTSDSGGDMTKKDFQVEYSKSNRAKCMVCDNVIPKDAIRIGKLDTESENSKRFGPLYRWFHTDCFADNRDQLGFLLEASLLPNFDLLKKEDKKTLLKKLPAIQKTKKVKVEPKVETKSEIKTEDAPDSANEILLKKQSDKLYKYTQMLKGLSRRLLEILISFNNITYNVDQQRNINYLADALTFGIPEQCPKCSSALRFKVTTYRCNGLTEWGAKCDYKTDSPKRQPMKIPPELESTPLKKYKYKPLKRVYNIQYKNEVERKEIEKVAEILNVKTEESNLPKESITNSKALNGYNIGLLTSSKEIKEMIRNLDGNVVKENVNNMLCYVCEANRFKKARSNKKFKHAQDNSIPIVSEEMLNNLMNGLDLLSSILTCKLTFWELSESDIGKRIEECNIKKKLDSAFKSGFKSGSTSGSGAKKLIYKDGAIVDPDSNLADVAHILKCGKSFYTAILNRVSVAENKNSYYKLQILEDDANRRRYWLFKSWGRIGTDIGGNNCNQMSNKEAAITEFKRVYYEHTGNDWDDRSNFQKFPNKYYPVDVDYGNYDEKVLNAKTSKSTLPNPVKELISRIFDVHLMKQTMLEFELDLDKMPLGKLSHSQLLNACSVLKEISKLLDSKPVNVGQLQGACNHFYTLVPHNFGTSLPPIINSQEEVAKKNQILESLIEMEVAYNIIKSTNETNSNEDPIDFHYKKLNNEITVLDKDSEEYKIIQKYAKHTHGKTHDQYKLELVDVFKLNREGEEKRFSKYRDVERMLLWHGSRITNFAGILSQGLRIAPPEAPVTGYMFGKGVYFADCVSKSANYCNATPANSYGLLVLSEVALGESLRSTKAKYVEKLDKKYMSVLGEGQSTPNPAQAVILPDKVKVPCGRLITNKSVKKSELLYNEYVIYKENQARMRYLVFVKFNFNEDLEI